MCSLRIATSDGAQGTARTVPAARCLSANAKACFTLRNWRADEATSAITIERPRRAGSDYLMALCPSVVPMRPLARPDIIVPPPRFHELQATSEQANAQVTASIRHHSSCQENWIEPRRSYLPGALRPPT